MEWKKPPEMLLLVAVSLTVACSSATPATTASEPRRIASQTQALVESAPGVYELRFEQASAAPQLGLFDLSHRLAVVQGDGELVVELSSSETMFSGTADEIDPHRWMAGLAGGEPLVMQMIAQHDGQSVTGSALVAVEGQSYEATFVATRAAVDAASPSTRSDPKAPATQYHLPDGIR